jgi:hypothetical protein
MSLSFFRFFLVSSSLPLSPPDPIVIPSSSEVFRSASSDDTAVVTNNCPSATPVSLRNSADLNSVATKLANYYALAVNENDLQAFRSCLVQLICNENPDSLEILAVDERPKEISEEDFSFIVNVYRSRGSSNVGKRGKKTPSSPVENPFLGNLTYAVLSMKTLCQAYENFLEIVPDGCMKLFSSRCCYHGYDCSVFITSFQYSGTIISSDNILLETRNLTTETVSSTATDLLSHQPDIGKQSADSVSAESSDSSCTLSTNTTKIRQIPSSVIASSCKEDYNQLFIIEGSLVMYRNNVTKAIYKIELFYEFLDA